MSSYNIVTENGEQFIPASQRPDGTWRKARRVKEGYIPQEEVPLYESKGKQFLNRTQEPVTLPSGQVARMPIPGLYIVENDTDKKNVKKKNKKKADDLSNNLEGLKLKESPKLNLVANTKIIDGKSSKKHAGIEKVSEKEQVEAKNVETADPKKKLKNLKKRLREVETLEEKLKSGSLQNPEKDQLAKIKRKNDLLLQIHELEKECQESI